MSFLKSSEINMRGTNCNQYIPVEKVIWGNSEVSEFSKPIFSRILSPKNI